MKLHNTLVPFGITNVLEQALYDNRMTPSIREDVLADLNALALAPETDTPDVAYVYAVRAMTTSLRKVGVSIDPTRRLGELQTGNHCALVLEETHAFPLREAYVMERWTHGVLTGRGQHVRGEWFDADGGVGLCALYERNGGETLFPVPLQLCTSSASKPSVSRAAMAREEEMKREKRKREDSDEEVPEQKRRRADITCKKCKKVFNTKKQLWRHVTNVHTRKIAVRRCDVVGCDYTTKRTDCIKKHKMRVHKM